MPDSPLSASPAEDAGPTERWQCTECRTLCLPGTPYCEGYFAPGVGSVRHARVWRPSSMSGIPRRNRVDLWTPAERAIQDAVHVVEAAGAHLLLTDAVTLLGQAREKVADFVDGQAARPPVPPSSSLGAATATAQVHEQQELMGSTENVQPQGLVPSREARVRIARIAARLVLAAYDDRECACSDPDEPAICWYHLTNAQREDALTELVTDAWEDL